MLLFTAGKEEDYDMIVKKYDALPLGQAETAFNTVLSAIIFQS